VVQSARSGATPDVSHLPERADHGGTGGDILKASRRLGDIDHSVETLNRSIDSGANQMPITETSESSVPLFPCRSLDETLDFYRTLGFEITYQQEDPYLYAVIRRGGVDLHFSKLTAWQSKNAVCLIFVPQIASYHKVFADALRVKYGKVPTAGLPRITRLHQGQTRFHIFDPSGNVLLYVNRDESEMDYSWYETTRSKLASAIDNAALLRDAYVNDKGAAQVLDKALTQNEAVDPIILARALAMRAELAVAMGDTERAQAVRLELRQISLSDEERDRIRHELQAADSLERWITQSDDEFDER
jgi:catechol 2,3-dioxygenase-like lactoylglutathione lyase family enzyme